MELINALSYNDATPYEELIRMSFKTGMEEKYYFDTDNVSSVKIGSDKTEITFKLGNTYESLLRVLCKTGVMTFVFGNFDGDLLDYFVEFRGYTNYFFNSKDNTITFNLYTKGVSLLYTTVSNKDQEVDYFTKG